MCALKSKFKDGAYYCIECKYVAHEECATLKNPHIPSKEKAIPVKEMPAIKNPLSI